jgi:hypothetical protein
MIKRNRMTRRLGNPRSDEGFAMALVITIVLIMFLMLAAMTIPMASDYGSSTRARSILSERQLAESVMNELFSESAKSSDLTNGFAMIGRVDSSATRSVDLAGEVAGWAEYDPTNGVFQTCSSFRKLCYYYTPQASNASPFVNVEVTTRSGCRSTRNGCVYRRFQQSWRRRSFVDYVVFTDMETLQPELYGTPGLQVTRPSSAPLFMSTADATAQCAARPFAADYTLRDGLLDKSRRQTSPTATAPNDKFLFPHRFGGLPSGAIDEFGPLPGTRRSENCFDIAYTGSAGNLDTIEGPIHTNDYFFWICGSPKFTAVVEAGGDPALPDPAPAVDAIFHPSLGAGCNPSGTNVPTSGTVGLPVNARRGEYLELPVSLAAAAYDRIATVVLTPTIGNTVTITMTAGNTMTVDTGGGPTTGVAVPYRGVVYVKGAANTLEISGTGADVTFVADGNLSIVGDIEQPASSGNSITLGFVAGGSTTIKQDPVRRKIAGAFLSLTGGMSVEKWNDPAAATLAVHPTLELNGAIIAKFRPVFGTYDASGELKSGMHKAIRYPQDASGNLLPPTPPYFLQPLNAVWVRLDFSETPIQSGTPGLTPKPADPVVSTASPSCGTMWPSTSLVPGGPTNYVPACLINTP